MSELNTFNLPDVGEGLTEAEIVSWKVKLGDVVAINDVLVEIETAKSIVELPSPYAGLVAQLLVEEGQTVEVGTPIIRIGSEQPTPIYGTPMYGTPAAHPKEPDVSASASPAPGPLVGSGPKADSVTRRPRRQVPGASLSQGTTTAASGAAGYGTGAAAQASRPAAAGAPPSSEEAKPGRVLAKP
ncbi:MAG TPA: biotin/lipoyl-containing protein, partial [Micrococcaceae bacterium]|nr:biotin/lipoyl-containing protein [Micrococcaceae bacterium]